MCFVLELKVGGAGPLHIQIANGIKNLISAGIIPSGYLLPASRVLSDHLDVSRNTVLKAYDNMASEGFIEMRPPLGTFVSDRLPSRPFDMADKGAKRAHSKVLGTQDLKRHGPQTTSSGFDFAAEGIDGALFPSKTWRRIAVGKLRLDIGAATQSSDIAGHPDLREAISHYLSPSRALIAGATQVIVTTGLIQAYNIVAQMVLSPGRRVVLETPCGSDVEEICRCSGAKIERVPVDANGMRTDLLPEGEASLVIVSTGRQTSLGVTLSDNRRRSLLDWAHRSDALILDADFSNDYRYTGLLEPALPVLDGDERTIYASSFDAALGVGSRLGFIVVPNGLVGVTLAMKARLGAGESWLEQVVMAEMLRRGEYKSHLLRLRSAMMQRRDALLRALSRCFGPSQNVYGQNGGSHVVWQLPVNSPPAGEVCIALQRRSIRADWLGDFACVDGTIDPHAHLILRYGAMQPDKIAAGIEAIAACLRELHISQSEASAAFIPRLRSVSAQVAS